MTWLGEWSHTIEEWILSMVGSWEIYPAVYGLSVVDGIFPVVPSESVVIGASAALGQDNGPQIALVWVVAAAGAWCGDQIAYAVGRAVDVRKFRLLRTSKGIATLDWAEHAITNRGITFIIAARFIPMGRVAVNLTAGALRYPRRRFMAIDAAAAMIWATYGVVLGLTASKLVEGNLLLSVVLGVVGGIILGFLVDKILARLGLHTPVLPHLAEGIEHDADVEAGQADAVEGPAAAGPESR